MLHLRFPIHLIILVILQHGQHQVCVAHVLLNYFMHWMLCSQNRNPSYLLNISFCFVVNGSCRCERSLTRNRPDCCKSYIILIVLETHVQQICHRLPAARIFPNTSMGLLAGLLLEFNLRIKTHMFSNGTKQAPQSTHQPTKEKWSVHPGLQGK